MYKFYNIRINFYENIDDMIILAYRIELYFLVACKYLVYYSEKIDLVSINRPSTLFIDEFERENLN